MTKRNIAEIRQNESPTPTEKAPREADFEAVKQQAANDDQASLPNLGEAQPEQPIAAKTATENANASTSASLQSEPPHDIVYFLPRALGRAIQEPAAEGAQHNHIREVATQLFALGISLAGVSALAVDQPFGWGLSAGERNDVIHDSWQLWKEKGSPLMPGSTAVLLKELLLTHSIVYVGGKALICRWRDDPDQPGCRAFELLTPAAFRLYHRSEAIPVLNSEGKLWFEAVSKEFMDRARRYEALVFAPAEKAVVNGCLNLWQGFGVKPVPGDWRLMRRHIEEVLANGDKAVAEYILKWAAWAVQNPGLQAEVALAFIGGRGSGKGVYGRAMTRLFGTHGLQISSSKYLVGAFNKHLMHCALLFCDEAFWAGDKQGESTLKALITEPTLTIEPKGVDAFSVANRLHVIMASNEDWIAPAGPDERRFAVTRVSDARRGDKGYFEALNAELENGGLEAMLHDLLAMDLKGWHPRQDVPQTRALLDQKIESLRGIDKVIADILQDGVVPCALHGRPDIARTSRDVDMPGFWPHCRQAAPELRSSSERAMMSKLRAWGCTPFKSGNVRGIQFPPLSALRAAFDAKYGPQEWDDTAEWGC